MATTASAAYPFSPIRRKQPVTDFDRSIGRQSLQAKIPDSLAFRRFNHPRRIPFALLRICHALFEHIAVCSFHIFIIFICYQIAHFFIRRNSDGESCCLDHNDTAFINDLPPVLRCGGYVLLPPPVCLLDGVWFKKYPGVLYRRGANGILPYQSVPRICSTNWN